MDMEMDRRQWLKTGALAAGGLLTGFSGSACRGSSHAPEIPSQATIETSVVRLKSNESPYGLSPSAHQAAQNALAQSHLYPHSQYMELKAKIAEREGLTPEHIILGAGSTEVMVMLIQLYGGHGEALAADPTYFDFMDYAEMAECFLRLVPLDGNFVHDLSAMEKEVNPRTSLIYICNPTNPTGTIVARDDLQSFCKRVSSQALVVVDEAYHEYVEDDAYGTMLPLIQQGVNIVVTRTFSKIYGMAGLRVGYGVADPEIIRNLRRTQRNFATLALPSLKAAVASYVESDFLRNVRLKNSAAKRYLYQELERRGLFYIPSQTNFVLFQIEQDARDTVKAFEAQGVLLRGFPIRDKNWIRVSIGTQAEMERFVAVLDRIVT